MVKGTKYLGNRKSESKDAKGYKALLYFLIGFICTFVLLNFGLIKVLIK